MSSNSYILCPGQGAQAIGMGKDVADAYPIAKAVFAEADAILGWELSSICFSGPEARLNQTDVSQPALFAAGVASYRAAVAAGVIEEPLIAGMAGLSLGEYTALHLAGAMSFEQGLKLVAARGKAMQEAAEATPSGMVAIIGADEAKVNELCQQAAEGEVLACANFNAPGQIVASGSNAACARLVVAAEAAGVMAKPLVVAGAFHSALMQPAADVMRRELERVELKPPRVPVFSNVTAKPHESAASIKQLLVEQIVSPVQWERTMQWVLNQPEAQFFELAPGRVLAGLAKRINRRAAVKSVGTAEAIAGLQQGLTQGAGR